MIKIFLIAFSLMLPIVFNSCQGFTPDQISKYESSIVEDDDSKQPININVDSIQLSAPNGIFEGAALILTVENELSFGEGPHILYRETGVGTLSQGHVKSIPEKGSATLEPNKAGFPAVESVSELPYGVGIVFGTENNSVNSTYYKNLSVKANFIYDEFFEHNYIYWPEDHQNKSNIILNEIEDSGVAGTWQSKPLWNMYTGYGYSGYKLPGAMDIFTGFIGWYSNTRKWQSGYVIQANAKPVSTTFRESTGLISYNQAPITPVLRQTWIKAGPTPGSGDGSDGSFYSSAINEGVLATYSLKNASLTSDVASVIGWDRFNYPGYVRGFNRPLDCHFYFADIYKAVGPNSRARFEVVDHQNYNFREKTTIFDIESWTSQQIEFKVREGIFYNQGLTGQHMYLTLGDGSQYYLGQIP